MPIDSRAAGRAAQALGRLHRALGPAISSRIDARLSLAQHGVNEALTYVLHNVDGTARATNRGDAVLSARVRNAFETLQLLLPVRERLARQPRRLWAEAEQTLTAIHPVMGQAPEATPAGVDRLWDWLKDTTPTAPNPLHIGANETVAQAMENITQAHTRHQGRDDSHLSTIARREAWRPTQLARDVLGRMRKVLDNARCGRKAAVIRLLRSAVRLPQTIAPTPDWGLRIIPSETLTSTDQHLGAVAGTIDALPGLWLTADERGTWRRVGGTPMQ